MNIKAIERTEPYIMFGLKRITDKPSATELLNVPIDMLTEMAAINRMYNRRPKKCL